MTLPYGSRPFAVLYADTWNDYGYNVLYKLEVHLENHDVIAAGNVKITSLGLESGAPLDIGVEFETLPEGFCSLGQEYTYYEALAGSGDTLLRQTLAGLRDVVLYPTLQEVFKNENSYRKGLLRFGSAERAIVDAPALLADQHGPDGPSKTRLAFAFENSVGGDDFTIEFVFADREHLPSRINAVIGYNGTGKTRLLANLAMIASSDAQRRLEPETRKFSGRFPEYDPAFGAVVAISYSAFDIFEIPDKGDPRSFGYTYCGLRKRGPDGAYTLKSPDEITDDFFSALKNARNGRQRDILVQVFDRLKQEPSFARVGLTEYIHAEEDTSLSDIRLQFSRLSTGHKIVLNIATQLVANLQLRSLILIDEPESHLHPPLLAALLRSVSEALDQRDSFAVVATHSPVVLQEVPSRYVSVLKRNDTATIVQSPESETFGENVGFLTRTVFNLDSSATDHHAILRRLAQFPMADIEQMFGTRLSNQARTYIMKIQRERAS
ncbi:AAA family ATPase [Pseudonocardia sp. GCM10023141]|uniref:AAA family ATPase n=1 Tax=Pseudonocardia sp. GCM10023141 TaxID=3252653 RepID=UPI00360CB33C